MADEGTRQVARGWFASAFDAGTRRLRRRAELEAASMSLTGAKPDAASSSSAAVVGDPSGANALELGLSEGHEAEIGSNASGGQARRVGS